MMQISQLFIYPIKSLGGIARQSVQITNTGFEHDRRWLLVDADNKFITQRVKPDMALLHVKDTPTGFLIYKINQENLNIQIPFSTESPNKIQVQIWDDFCDAAVLSEKHNEWFSHMMGMPCKLVYMPNESLRYVDINYANNHEITSFSDGFPVLMLGEQSLNDLNERLNDALPVNRFRPNIVFSGGHPHIEDEMLKFCINELTFFGVKPCARCIMTTINQQNAHKGKEPLTTLATYRMKNNKIYFGQNVLPQQNGRIALGDSIQILQQGFPLF